MERVTALTIPTPSIDTLAHLAVQSLASASSRRNYAREMRHYLESRYPITREGVQCYMNLMREMGKGSVTRNIALAAIRLLAREANLRGQLDDQTLTSIERIRGVKVLGQRTGNWLDLGQVRLLLAAAHDGTSIGTRNQALLSCLVGCGMRRLEATTLKWSQWQLRAGRWCWVDVVGKGQRRRTIPSPEWASERIEAWKVVCDAPLASGCVLGAEALSIERVFYLSVDRAYEIVVDTAHKAGLGEVRPHDLRRTWARLSREGGAPLEQIQQGLGHASVATTERYLAMKLDLRPGFAAADYIQISGNQPQGEEK